MGNKESKSQDAEEEVCNGIINLLILGRAGTGKSSTGNNILGQQCFEADDRDSVVTTHCQFEYSRYEGKGIKVVDMPGLGDNSKSRDEDVKHVVGAALDAVAETPDGYDALLVVTQYGRQTEDDRTTIDELKQMFGEKVLKQYGILVVTRGDDFKRWPSKNKTFEEYCSQQTGQINKLWRECNKRAVLFDNITTDTAEIESQRHKLFAIVKEMRETKRYTPELFKTAKATRDEMIRKAEKFAFTETTRMELRLVLQDLKGISIDTYKKDETKLEKIKERAEVLVQNISFQQKSTGMGANVLKFAKSLEAAVTMKEDLISMVSKCEVKKQANEKKVEEMDSAARKTYFKEFYDRENRIEERNIENKEKEMQNIETQLSLQYMSLEVSKAPVLSKLSRAFRRVTTF